MENGTLGRVVVSAKVENIAELYLARKGTIPASEVRALDIPEARVDTGATTLAMPLSMIQHLGLDPLRTRQARTTAGLTTFRVYGAVRLTVQGRDCTVDVTEIPEDCPVLIGQVPLELLDFVVDPKNQRLIGNPEHGGEPMMDMY